MEKKTFKLKPSTGRIIRKRRGYSFTPTVIVVTNPEPVKVVK